ncbi:MAG: SLBB domain-containing protein [Nitrospirota bacterium]
MKKIIFLLGCIALLQGADPVFSQQAVPPAEAAQAITSAIQQGNLKAAGELYQASLKGQQTQTVTAPSSTANAVEESQASLFERTLPGTLKQFGYDLFNKTVSSFAPPITMSVGPDYTIGPGDQFTLTLWGTTEGIYNLQVSKEGRVTLPKVGVVSVAGIRFGELERTLKRHLSKYYSEFNLSVAMGGLKSITIYTVGEVVKPGSYSLSSLTTVYGALFAAGGPTKQGTLRTIQVLRSGKVIKTIDLYEFLLKGDRSQDIKLQNEDTVFVPLIGPIAGVAGTVYRPAIYELKGRETISDLIQTAGGILPMALGGRLQLTRYVDNQKKIIQDIRLEDQNSAEKKQTALFTEKIQNMDSISISPVYTNVWETVEVNGAVEHAGTLQWRPDLKLKEVVLQAKLLPRADMKRADVVRVSKNMIEKMIIPIDLGLLMSGDEASNIPLEPKDKIEIYSVDQNPRNIWETVNLAGTVRNPGNYQWRPELKVREIIIEGQLLPKTDLKRADVIRLNKDLQDRTIMPLDLEKLMAGDESQNIALLPQDQIRVYSSFKNTEKVMVLGEVVRTGEYEIDRDERMSDLLRRAGGFTKEAYPYGAVFKRADVKNSQEKNLQSFVVRMQSQVLQNAAAGSAQALSAEDAAAAKAEMTLNQAIVENIKNMREQYEGRVAINITDNLEQWAGSPNDLLLKDGDSILIPKRPQEVMVAGEVHSPSAQVFLPGLRVKDVINNSGGYTKHAEKDQVYVLQANGAAVSGDSPSIGSIEDKELQAGDTIFVPQKTDRNAGMRLTKDIVDILFKTAVVIATITILF